MRESPVSLGGHGRRMVDTPARSTAGTVELRAVRDEDVRILHRLLSDPEVARMVAFGAERPQPWSEFNEHWTELRTSPDTLIRTVEWNGEVVGYVGRFRMFGKPSIAYEYGRPYWGRGIATRALVRFLVIDSVRPLCARAAKDNLGSVRVLEKCGFRVVSEEMSFAKGRGREIPELVLELAAPIDDRI
jgi:RimJ/RimL family protein N-acetyltransferase